MPQSSELIKALKKQLRASGITYQQVADSLDLSEASVKRLFSEESFTLQRLESIALLAGLEISDLVMLAQKNRQQLETLTPEQEEEIAADLVLLMVTVSVINGFSYQDLLSYFELSEHECIQKLAKLDRLGLLDLLPGNRIKLRISPNFRWQRNGAIQKFFQEKVEKEFFSSRFEDEREKLLVLNGLFSPASNKLLQELMDQFSHEFNDLHRKDSALPIGKKFGTTVVFALREWQYNLFADYVKPTAKNPGRSPL